MKDFLTKNRYLLAIAAVGVAGAIIGARMHKRMQIEIADLIQPLWPSLALWCLFELYWSIAARNAAKTKTSEPWTSTLLHKVLMNVSVLLLFLRVPGLDRRWLPITSFLAPIGIAIQAGCTFLAIWARRHLGRYWSGAITTKVDHRLIRSGPYRLVRHPIYTAILGMCAGVTIASGEWHAIVGVAGMAFAYWRKIRLEERNLCKAFGPEYDAFRRDSWALIPWLL